MVASGKRIHMGQRGTSRASLDGYGDLKGGTMLRVCIEAGAAEESRMQRSDWTN